MILGLSMVRHLPMNTTDNYLTVPIIDVCTLCSGLDLGTGGDDHRHGFCGFNQRERSRSQILMDGADLTG